MRLSERLHNALFALFLLAMAGYGVAFAAHMLTQFDIVNLVRDVNKDDSFYYFEIASNMAEGQFSTFDGGITRTNGYHPLWLWLITPFYWFLDKEAALFAIKALEILLIAGAAMLVAGAARLARLPWILLLGLLPALYQIRALYLGLEAAAGLFTLALFLLALVLYGRDAARWRRLLAAVAFVLPWARLEYVAISLAGTGALLLLEWTWQERRREKARFTVPNLRTFVPMFGAIAGILLYFAYNQAVFGGPVPVSGATKQAWSQDRWQKAGGYDFAQNLREMMALPVFDDELLVAAGIIVGAALLWWWRRREDRLLLLFLAGVASLAAGHLAKFAQSALTVHPVLAWYSWYFVPAYLMMALAYPVGCMVALYLARRFVAARQARVGGILSAGLVVGGTMVGLAQADLNGPFRNVEWNRAEVAPGWETLGLMSTLIMNRLLPEGSIIGSWDAGIPGYFSRYPVVNLDGLVNDYAYLRQYGGEYGAGNATRFGTTYYAQAQWYRRRAGRRADDDNIVIYENKINDEEIAGKSLTFNIWTPELRDVGSLTDFFWKRMEQHFSFATGGVGLVLDGRLAQAFAQECGPDEWVLWRWSQGGEERSAGDAWTKTQTGLCAAVRILPPGAGPEVSAETLGREALLAALVGDAAPAIAADFEVWLAEGQLVYRREDCAAEDVDATFFLHIVPLEVEDLPAERREYGFENLDFDFERYGTRDGDTCLALAPLRTYDIAEIHTGQSVARDGGFENLWRGAIQTEPLEALVAALVGDAAPAIAADFEVWLAEGQLVYRRQNCAAEDVDAPFFLHLVPLDVGALPAERREYGFENRDFLFEQHGRQDDESCLALVPLPGYGIAEIRTGQYVARDEDFENLWTGTIRPA